MEASGQPREAGDPRHQGVEAGEHPMADLRLIAEGRGSLLLALLLVPLLLADQPGPRPLQPRALALAPARALALVRALRSLGLQQPAAATWAGRWTAAWWQPRALSHVQYVPRP